MATQKNIIDEAFPETLKILSELIKFQTVSGTSNTVSYTHLRAHETKANLVCRLLLEKKKYSRNSF